MKLITSNGNRVNVNMTAACSVQGTEFLNPLWTRLMYFNTLFIHACNYRMEIDRLHVKQDLFGDKSTRLPHVS